jgi:hypothetical protein
MPEQKAAEDHLFGHAAYPRSARRLSRVRRNPLNATSGPGRVLALL